MTIVKKLSFNLLISTILLILCFSTKNIALSISANETSDYIFNEWEIASTSQFDSMYCCPELNPERDDVLNYCMSVVDAKKGNLIDDKYSAFLYFEYSMNDFVDMDEFFNYYQQNIYYPLFSIYPDTAFCATAKSYYGTGYDCYTIIIELCVNGQPHANVMDTYVNGELFTGYSKDEAEEQQLASVINQLADEAEQYSNTDKGKLEYVYNYLVDNVTYGINDMRAYTSYGALFDNLAVCQGYTMTIQDVCYVLDIPCVMNFSIEDNHGWNSVFVDGQWQLIDATNSHFMDVSEQDAPELLPIHHFDKDMLSAIQTSVMTFNNLTYAPQTTNGDVDNNGQINSEDALIVLTYVAGSVVPDDEEFQKADIDGDGQVTSYDALLILQTVVGL